MNIRKMHLADLNPASYNPRKELKPGDPDFEKLKRSIQAFGYVEPIVVNERTGNTVISGHQRLNVLKHLGETEADCVIVDMSMNDEKALNVAMNKVSGEWDIPKLESVIEDLRAEAFDVTLTGFDFGQSSDKSVFFEATEAERDAMLSGTQEYQEFVDKFKEAKTTDDCYTPEIIYNAIAEYVSRRYKVDRKHFVRPFYPGGDYEKEPYDADNIVVDNPPFSIFKKIVDFYTLRKIRFFLFGPSMSILHAAESNEGVTVICCASGITYENGACVPTSFITNLDDPKIIARTDPELFDAIKKADTENQKKNKRTLPKYSYPDNVCTAAMLNYMCIHHVDYKVARKACVIIEALDEQRKAGKAIFGKGMLLAEKAAAEKAAAEKAAAEKAAAEKAAAEKWQLSKRERAIVRELS